jgi:hypothetical protein
MASILFSVFSGQASAISDNLIITAHNKHVKAKETGEETKNHTINIVQTQWDNGGHTGYLLRFYEWLRTEGKLKGEVWKGFLLPPPMGDLKSQISRWCKFLIGDEYKATIASLIGSKHDDLDISIKDLEDLIGKLQKLSPEIFDENKMNFLSTYCNYYREYVEIIEKEKKKKGDSTTDNHSVGNLFLSFLYFYSFLVRDIVKFPHYHHHEIFFNFLKNLGLVPRGIRLEFLIDGRFNLTGQSFDGQHIKSEKWFDDYPAAEPVNPETYNLEAVDGEDIETKFYDLVNISDVVVIPPGSLSNWMPLVNKFKDALLTKPVIWIVNSFHHISEVVLRQQLEYMQSLGIKPIILAPLVDNPYEELDVFSKDVYEKKYKKQRKEPETFSKAFAGYEDSVVRCIPLRYMDAGEGGIKYNAIHIEMILSTLMDRIDMAAEINNETVLKVCNEIAYTFFPENRSIK